jgi:hypothetical protein
LAIVDDADIAGRVVELDARKAFRDVEADRRRWVRSIGALLQGRSRESDPSGRVQLAFDMMHIAACERMFRILRSDLPGDAAGC